MASRKNSLSKYVHSRKKKYSCGYQFLIHVSNSPHKILVPQITSYAYQTIIRDEKNRIISCDYERFQPLVYLSSLNRFTDWVDWCVPHSSKGNAYGYVTLYAHIVRVSFDNLKILKNRYCEELVSHRPLVVERIIPFRYNTKTRYKPINRDQVLRKLDQVKNSCKYAREGHLKVTTWFMGY
jgi:hypothetical protein